MKKVFIGFLLIFLDFNLTVGSSTIGLIPDFIGYVFLVKGLAELAAESPRLARLSPVVIAMGVFSVVLYVLDVLGISSNFGVAGFLLGVADTAISLYIGYTVIAGIRDIELARGVSLVSGKLKSTLTVLAVFQVLTYVSILLPTFLVAGIIGAFICAVVFLVQLFRSMNLYEASRPIACAAIEPD